MPRLEHLPFAACSLFSSAVVRIGITRCDPDHVQFSDPGPVGEHCFLFPQATIRIQRDGQRALVLGAGDVVFHNRGQVVRREEVAGRGDEHTWFALESSVVLDVQRSTRPEVEEHADAPFRVSHGPGDAAGFLAQQLLIASLCRKHARAGSEAPDPPEALEIEETALHLLRHVLGRAEGTLERRRRAPSPAPPERVRELGERAKHVLGRHFHERTGLDGLAARVGCSQFHLARSFRWYTGQTLHEYRSRLRLGRALVEVLDGERDLTSLALRLGYSSHSHMTGAFQRAYGASPSGLRSARLAPSADALADRRLRRLRQEALRALDRPGPV